MYLLCIGVFLVRDRYFNQISRGGVEILGFVVGGCLNSLNVEVAPVAYDQSRSRIYFQVHR